MATLKNLSDNMVRMICRIATSSKMGWRYHYNNEGKQIMSKFASKMFYVLAIDYYNGNDILLIVLDIFSIYSISAYLIE